MKKFLIAISLLSATASFAQTDIEAGKTLFKSRCAACHNIDKVLVGPALKDVEKRHSEKWIIDFVRSSQTMIKNGDKEAVAVFNQMNQNVMPDQDLKDAEILDILSYIKDESAKLEAKANEAPFARPAEAKGGDKPLDWTNDRWVFIGFFAFVILLVVALVGAVKVQSIIRSKEKPKENE